MNIIKIISASWIAVILCDALAFDIPLWLMSIITCFAIMILFDLLKEEK